MDIPNIIPDYRIPCRSAPQPPYKKKGGLRCSVSGFLAATYLGISCTPLVSGRRQFYSPFEDQTPMEESTIGILPRILIALAS